MPPSAFAARDPAPDRIGIYFDTNADRSTTTVPTFMLDTAYIVVTNPTFPSLYRLEASIRAPQSSVFWIAADVAGGGTNTATLPEFAVTYEARYPTQPVTILATVTFLVAQAGPVCLVLAGISSSAIPGDLPVVWTSPEIALAIEPSRLYANGVAASINDDTWPAPYLPYCEDVVATESRSWGVLKSLYR
jgi:hypothetical protein